MSKVADSTPKACVPEATNPVNTSPVSRSTVPEVPTFTVYKPPNDNSGLPPTAISDDFFTMTTADIKAAHDTLSARTRAMVNAPLQLRSAREANERAKRERWQNTSIRVKFSDRTQLERVFPSSDNIASVYTFVRDCLRDDVKSKSFILYQSPPKRDFKISDPKIRDQSLAQLLLAPSSVLLLRFEDEVLNRSDTPAPLLPSMISRAIDLPKPPDFNSASSASVTSSSASKPADKSSSSTSKSKVPKWLKLGQKK